jgi:hypothetical protein
MTAPTSLIINSAFLEPAQHWAENPDRTLRIEPSRRPAGYEIIDTRENTRRTVPLPLVDDIRKRVLAWREAGWPGTTEITRDLLRHWWDQDRTSRRDYRFYFCQLEAAETLIWWVEGADEFRQGVNIPGDGGPFERLCNKMATGAGKTTVMAMVITWQVLNALTYPKRTKDFSRAILVMAPGLTVKDRLRVLYPGDTDNYYDAFDLCPADACLVRPGAPTLTMTRTAPPSEIIAAVERLAVAAGLEVGGIEYLIDDRDGSVLFYDINGLSNFVARPVEVLGFDPHDDLVDWLKGIVAEEKGRRA